ncbi:MAG TPA: 1-(5-phosphoribosyl)-5-[(5-phosphoribosylamino)methylideneamino]imidazole-4-carboxamide isomerase [Gemmatimonadales bacterium]|nr:1-(5-phosphoribosyl)-5-[(5-phosphoribosylamino)methylideneamino]imidazole-4-carboxamide isomerase [Gemmatimonadales bacterium]
MELYPAIDIRSGRVVRLSQGETTRQTVYGNDPAAVAEAFVAAGARWIHVVDLDRALGEGDNESAVRRVVRRVAGRAAIQAGGGFRTLDLVRRGVDLGLSRIVVGTAAATEPDFLAALAAQVPTERLAVGIDARDGKVAVRGWTETSSLTAVELARRAGVAGIHTLIYTDVARDGMLQGPDLSGALRLQEEGAAVIVSGGVASLVDLQRAAEAGLAGAIVGRAIYEGRFHLPQALQAAARSPIR